MFYEKRIEPGEHACRNAHLSIKKAILRILGKDELTSEQRKWYAKALNDEFEDSNNWEQQNSKDDFQLGELYGFLKGTVATIGTIVVGFNLGKLITYLASKKK